MGADSLRYLSAVMLDVRAHSDDVGTGRRQRIGYGESDAAAGAGDDRDLPGQVEKVRHPVIRIGG
jgi:hypothetical protein